PASSTLSDFVSNDAKTMHQTAPVATAPRSSLFFPLVGGVMTMIWCHAYRLVHGQPNERILERQHCADVSGSLDVCRHEFWLRRAHHWHRHAFSETLDARQWHCSVLVSC